MSNPINIADVQAGKQIAKSAGASAPSTASAFANADSFALLQRIGNMFSRSQLVPQNYRGESGMADCIIAVNMANRIGADPLMVMQNLYVVHGKPAWSGQFVIAAINQSGRFAEPLHFEEVGTKGQDDWGFRAEAITKSGRVIKGPTVTIEMAKAEGWWGKNPKWKNMPELMLRYRAGSMFGRTECPELLMGFNTDDEVRDTIDVDPSTGEVLGRTARVISPEEAQAAPAKKGRADTVEVAGDELDADGFPFPATDDEQAIVRAKQLQDWGYFESAEGEFINANGEVWNPEIHAASSDHGLPIINSDGSFRARRGAAKQTETQSSTPAQGSEEEKENGPDSSDSSAEGSEGFDLD